MRDPVVREFLLAFWKIHIHLTMMRRCIRAVTLAAYRSFEAYVDFVAARSSTRFG
jgi:hypothetical protein